MKLLRWLAKHLPLAWLATRPGNWLLRKLFR